MRPGLLLPRAGFRRGGELVRVGGGTGVGGAAVEPEPGAAAELGGATGSELGAVGAVELDGATGGELGGAELDAAELGAGAGELRVLELPRVPSAIASATAPTATTPSAARATRVRFGVCGVSSAPVAWVSVEGGRGGAGGGGSVYFMPGTETGARIVESAGAAAVRKSVGHAVAASVAPSGVAAINSARKSRALL